MLDFRLRLAKLRIKPLGLVSVGLGWGLGFRVEVSGSKEG